MIKQGEIYMADLNPVKGHEQTGFRPVLVIQDDVLNKNLNTVIVAPITSNLKAKGRLATYFISKSNSNLKQSSVALLFQIRTLDKRRLVKKVSKLGDLEFKEVKKQLMFVLFGA